MKKLKLDKNIWGQSNEAEINISENKSILKRWLASRKMVKSDYPFLSDSPEIYSFQHLPLQYYTEVYKVIPSVLYRARIDLNLGFDDMDCLWTSENSEDQPSSAMGGSGRIALFRHSHEVLVYVMIYSIEDLSSVGVTVFYSPEKKKEARTWLQSLPEQPPEEISPKIAYIVQIGNALGFRSSMIEKNELNLDYYNDGLEEVDIAIKQWAGEWNKTGVAILHGEPGTGKTSYIRHLAGELANVTYVPSGLAQEIGSPSFLSFLADNPRRIYVIEDAENVIVSDGHNRTPALQNLLNATDGLMGDIIKSKFILTFNTDISNVDEALLRQGRASIIHKFDKLNANKSQALLEKLNKQNKGVAMSLAQIFNAPPVGSKEINKKKAKLGF